MVQRALHLDGPPAVVPSPRPTGHRARVKLALQGGQLGYRGARSHALVQVDTCSVARPEVAAAIAPLRDLLRDHPALPAADVELRSDGARVVYAFHGAGSRPSAAEREALASLGDVAWDGRAMHGDPVLRLSVAGLTLRASPDAFYQVNLEGNALLVEHVRRAIADARPERLLDLYAGIGNLGLPLAASGVPLLAVEHAGASLHDLSTTAAELGLAHVRALPLDAARFDPSREPFDAVILDPPRAGAGEVLPRVLRNRPRRAVLVSCDVLAASRDHRAARDAGYTLQDVTLFDLFPDTHHVEVVSVWDRPAAGPRPRR
jgi:23S rRNA (uracil1939-C5)-methyltransferase